MLWLYNFGILSYGLLLRFFALFHPKARLFIEGRKHQFERISKSINQNNKHIWFHFASLGEFEQGRPVLEALRKQYPQKKIVVTFFSPSGYENRKNYPLAEGIFYLPLDTPSNAKKFIAAINPEMAIFTKYEYWYHYFKVLHIKNIPLFIISGIFRSDQIFFKWYGGFYREILGFVNHFFVQNPQSIELLNSIGYKNASLSGDTRFDRVAEHVASVNRFEIIEKFCDGFPVCVAGSTWPQDELLLSFLIQQKHLEWKFIIAPHEIGENHINDIQKLIPDAVRYSDLNTLDPADNDLKIKTHKKVLLIDNIGLLSSLYQYGKIAYIGGGFGAGIHNTLEAAAFGIPIIFGPKHHKFQEAKDLLTTGAAISIGNNEELLKAFETLAKNPKAGNDASQYVKDKTGATDQILDYIKKFQ